MAIKTVQTRLGSASHAPAATALAELIVRMRETIPEILATLRDTMDRAPERAAFAVELFDVETWQLKPLASALDLSGRVDPALVRYGLRLAVMTGLATLLYRWLHIPHGYWIPFTIVVIMRPSWPGRCVPRATNQYLLRLDRALEALARQCGLPDAAAGELAACARDLDTLPPPPVDASGREGLVLTHLARAATETRAMIAASAG